MKNKFVPYENKIQVNLFEEDSMLRGETPQYEQMGTVIAVGSKVKSVKKGDFIYFLKHGCEKITKEGQDGIYVVTEDPNIILGYERRTK